MNLYNTMSRKVEVFKPINEEKVTVYTCGPTVYLDPHIGNWRTFINYDLLARTLRASGYGVTQVLNITDVGHLVGDGDEGEDKMSKTAAAQRKTAWEVAEHYTNVFTDGIKQLNIESPEVMPKATEHIQDQIDMVKSLEEKGFTYTINDGVYFDISKVDDYGKLARTDIEGQLAGARVEKNREKRNPQDFALWKLSSKDEKRDMEWDSPWGVGFPGWHIECSAMALKYLGPTIDIHGGGIDHIPIHHTNEIAQSESANGVRFAYNWFHSAFMTVDGTKMSKSIGNVYTLVDLAEKDINPLAFRLLVIQAHYRTESNFTWEALEAAAQRLRHLQAFADLAWQSDGQDDTSEVSEAERTFIEAMEDDLNTPVALEAVSRLINLFDNRRPNDNEAKDIKQLLKTMDAYLGLDLSGRPNITAENLKLIEERSKARADKDWAKSDEIRDKLTAQNISINDTPNGSIWAQS